MSRKPAAVIEIESRRKASGTQHPDPQPPANNGIAISKRRLSVLPQTRDDITRRWIFDETSTRDLRMALISGGKPVGREFVESVIRAGVIAKLQRKVAA